MTQYKWEEDKNIDNIEEDDFYIKHDTYIAEKCDEHKRPKDKELNGGYDKGGTYWGDFDYICNYVFVERKTEDDK